MRKVFFIFLLCLLTSIPSFGEEPFKPVFWIKGRVEDAPGVPASGRKIYFENTRASDTIGLTGNSGRPNEFVINAGEAGILFEPGKTYSIFTEMSDNFGLGPEKIELTGVGFQEVGPFSIKAGAGVANIQAFGINIEQTPEIKIWFNNRAYQKNLVQQGKDFFSNSKPEIKMEVKLDEPYRLDDKASGYNVLLDNKPLSVASSRIEKNKAVFEINITDPLPVGKHDFTFQAKSSGALAASATGVEIATVTVSGGPLRILDQPLCFPSPFNPERDKNVIFQYTLSKDADMEIYIYSISGELAKKISVRAGEEGGVGQMNKLKWDGITEQGSVISNGVYLVNFVAKEERKVLDKVKLSVYR